MTTERIEGRRGCRSVLPTPDRSALGVDQRTIEPRVNGWVEGADSSGERSLGNAPDAETLLVSGEQLVTVGEELSGWSCEDVYLSSELGVDVGWGDIEDADAGDHFVFSVTNTFDGDVTVVDPTETLVPVVVLVRDRSAGGAVFGFPNIRTKPFEEAPDNGASNGFPVPTVVEQLISVGAGKQRAVEVVEFLVLVVAFYEWRNGAFGQQSSVGGIGDIESIPARAMDDHRLASVLRKGQRERYGVDVMLITIEPHGDLAFVEVDDRTGLAKVGNDGRVPAIG